MNTVLIVPDSAARKAAGVRQRSRLTWTTDHSQSHYGLGVLLYANGDMLDGFSFRGLRDALGAVIETTDQAKACGALGVPEGEPGIMGVNHDKTRL
jgi:hypothetical protein